MSMFCIKILRNKQLMDTFKKKKNFQNLFIYFKLENTKCAVSEGFDRWSTLRQINTTMQNE